MSRSKVDSTTRNTLSSVINLLGIPLFIIAVVASFWGAKILLLEPPGTMGDFPFWGFFLHCVGAFFCGLGVFVALGSGEESRTGWGLYTGIFAFLAGPVGVLGSILCYLLARGQPRVTPLTEVVKAEMFVTVLDEEEPDEVQSLDLKIREEAQVEPLIDMLPLADIPTAIAIVNRLRERGSKTDIEMIREVSNDSRPEVYQYALAILDKMEKEFAGEVYVLSEEIAQRPTDAQLRVEMAKLHINYMNSGLLDESLSEYYWELTLSHLFEAMLSHPDKSELGSDFAQLLATQGLVQEASTVAKQILKKDPSLIQAQLLVLRSLFEGVDSDDTSGLIEAHKTSLENAWAVRVPKKRSQGIGPTFDLANFWFGGSENA